MSFDRYNLRWPDGTHPLTIEFHCIRKGGAWVENGVSCGAGMFHHFKQAQKLLWPSHDHTRWSDAVLRSFCEHEITVLIGCSDSGKTFGISKIVLVDYWAAPDKTLWLVSTTEGRGSELRIYGVIKDLFNEARQTFDWLQGNPVDYLKTITTESVDEERREARSLRRGIIVIPCKTGGIVSGLAPYIGIKAPRLRHAGDEVQAMNEAFLNAYANWMGKQDMRGIMSGNFMETDDPLGMASEPEDGWDSFIDSGKTQEWTSRFYHAHVVALDGRDSPNKDQVTKDGKPRYSYLISDKKLNLVRDTYGEDSWQWWSQCVGKPVKGMDIWRVLSRDFCIKHHANEDVIWRDAQRNTKLYALDPAYGGGDLCVGRQLEMGENVEGKQILFSHPPEIIPIRLSTGSVGEAEEQIARFVFTRLKDLGISPKNCFYDSFGRGTLGNEFAKLMGAECPAPVDSGAKCTSRPVRFDLFVEEKDGRKRLKRCDEHYYKFVTEMWFSVREAIDSEQVRGLDRDTIREGCSRKFTKNGDNKIEIEPKEDYKERNSGRSPDRMDNLAIGVEGARRIGFKIQRLGSDIIKSNKPDWLDEAVLEYQELLESRSLTRAR